MAPVSWRAAPADVNASDPYAVLGVGRFAEEGDIAKAYKRLALRYHPDKNPKDRDRAEAAFKNIAEAYGVLSDPSKRRTHDLGGGRRDAPSDSGSSSWSTCAPRDSESDRSCSPADPRATPGQFGRSGSKEEADDLFRTLLGQAGGFGAPAAPSAFPWEGAAGGAGPACWACPEPMDCSDDDGAPPGRDKPNGRGPRGGGRGGTQATRQALPPGSSVAVRGLDRSPEHNGKRGKVVCFNAAKGRYTVTLDGSSAQLALRPQNVMQFATVELYGLADRPELNGKRGVVVGSDEEVGRYLVEVEGQADSLSLRRASCLLARGCRVVLADLANPHHNDRMATVHSVDRENGRYTVKCQNGEQLKVKLRNAHC